MSLVSPASLKIIYGTAWKKERTKDLVYRAIASGFRAIDTACQPKHYSERLVTYLILSVVYELNFILI
jgi:diketogulonate reductase-like aldo/keto reductase